MLRWIESTDVGKKLKQRLPLSFKKVLKGTLRPDKRKALALKYLRGDGIEIGALGYPLPVGPQARVKYVDYLSEDQIHEKHSTYATRTVPDYVENGFTLPSFKNASVDFVIANHVLEHSPDPLGALLTWSRVLRPGGILYLTVPIKDRCFDFRREITPLENMIGDYDAYKSGNTATCIERNRAHYKEWVEKVDDIPLEQQAALMEKLSTEQAEIHFHTFTHQSYRQLLDYFCQHMALSMAVIDHQENDKETIAILKKNPHI